MSQNLPLFVYRARIEALAEKRTGQPMYNDSVEHAVIILQNIFLHAHHSVKILTGELNPEAYARRGIVEDVKHFIEDDRHNLQILFEAESLGDKKKINRHPFLREIAGCDRVQLRHVPQGLQQMYNFHFVLMDEDSYRFEPDKERFGAVAAFGDKDGGMNLARLFSVLWEKSTPPAHSSH